LFFEAKTTFFANEVEDFEGAKPVFLASPMGARLACGLKHHQLERAFEEMPALDAGMRVQFLALLELTYP